MNDWTPTLHALAPAYRTPHFVGPVLCDFESRSRCKLPKRGGRNYWEDPSSEALCGVGYDVPTGRWFTWTPDRPPPRIDHAVAHNASTFDRFAAARAGWGVGKWTDSAALARRSGLPGALDALAKIRLGREKDYEGNRFTLALSHPSRAKATLGQLPEITPEKLARVVQYCRNDVEVMVDAWGDLVPWAEVDADVYEVDQIVNDRGFPVDLELVDALEKQHNLLADEVLEGIGDEIGVGPLEVARMARSVPQFTEATGLPNAQAATLTDRASYGNLLDHPLVRARQAIASVVPGKLRAVRDRVSPDGRIRDALKYYGSHTGRWSGQGFQPHNLPRAGFEGVAEDLGWEVGDVIAALVEGAFGGERISKYEVDGLLRSVIAAPEGRVLGVLDYSGIEARANAWAAGDEDALEVFRALDAGHGHDPYKVMATNIFGGGAGSITKPQRTVGKMAELGCGYGMGASKFAAQCEGYGIDLVAAGTDADAVVYAWRGLHKPIVSMWYACEKAFASACEGVSARAGRWEYRPVGDDVWCVLPSGRPLVYREARAKRVQRRARNGRTFPGWALSYQGHRFREHVYGGLLVENAIQAKCRDLLADALVRAERAGLNPVLHVHDEIVCECDRRHARDLMRELDRIMTDAPSWAEGMPIVTDGFAEERYRK